MTRRFFGAALAVAAWLGGWQGDARAEDQLALTRDVLAGLADAANQLQQGDTISAAGTLARMQGAIATLKASAERYREAAKQAEALCQARSVQVIQQRDATFQQIQALENQQTNLLAQLQALSAQRNYVAMAVIGVSTQRAAVQQDIERRYNCNHDAGYYFRNIDFCFGAVAETVFTRKDQDLQNSLNDLLTQQTNLQQQTDQISGQFGGVSQNAANLRQIESANASLLTQLDAQNRTLRGVATALSDITLFWGKAAALVSNRVENPVAILQTVLPLLDRTEDTPVFGTDDQGDIRTLRTTLLDFGKTLDTAPDPLQSAALCAPAGTAVAATAAPMAHW